jgi:uncharacterized protein (TIGR03000 family)
VNPPGWYTNTYLYHWQYPWYAYYNYSQGPYANWMRAQGFAGYANQKQTSPEPMSAEVTITLPEDAILSFSGVVAKGTGNVRTFTTPVLTPGVEYVYEMTIEVSRDGKPLKTTKMVPVHPGENVKVAFETSPPPPAKK